VPEQFTLIGYASSQNTGGVLTNIAALADPHVTVSGNRVTVPGDLPNILGIYAGGAHFTQARVSAPSLLSAVLPDIAPLNVSAEPTVPTPYLDLFENPIPLTAAEQLEALGAGDETSSEYKTILVWLGRGPITPYKGPYYTVRGTGSTTLTAYAWTNVAITLGQTLPAGRYQVVGFRAQSTGAIAARLVFPGGTWRPGVIAYDSVADVESPRFRFGNCGVFGEFAHDQPPTVDFLSVSADTSQVVWLDIIKVA
jgi:hypothetical protein